MDFEKLDVWRKSSRLSADLYLYFKSCKDYGFKDQITRSGLSVPSNIAEGMTRETEREKYRYLSIAKGSCAELRTQIYIDIEVQYIEKEVGTNWLNQTRLITAMLEGLMEKLKPR